MKMEVLQMGVTPLLVLASFFICAVPSWAIDVPGCEKGKLCTVSDEALSRLDGLFTQRIAAIRATPNMDVPEGAPRRYLSPHGDDAADGLTPSTAWRTTQRLNAERLGSGSFVPHDMAGLIARCGGREAFCRRAEYALENGIVDFGNEPGFLVPWLFAYVGRGDLAAKGAHEVAKLFAGDDLPGDNDSGAMNALYVFLKLGLFPVAGQDTYIMHGCAYPRIEIKLSRGKTFVIRAVRGGSAVKAVMLNGHPHDPLFLRHSEIASGGELVFVK